VEYPIFQDNAVVSVELPAHIEERLAALPYRHDAYFLTSDATVCLNLGELVFSRAREKGILNASTLMMDAFSGKGAKRAPISVSATEGGGFVVIDGNSTALNALFSRWTDIPAIIISETDR